MSWTTVLTRFQKFTSSILSCGPIPHHIAFIMDGNRRFSRREKIDVGEAYQRGYSRLMEMTAYCSYFGVKEVTFYAFAIDNFKRSPEEINRNFKLFNEALQLLISEQAALTTSGICFRLLGNYNYLSAETKRLVAELMLITKDNTTIILNLALAYGARDEICQAMKTVAEGVRGGLLQAEDVDDRLISSVLYTKSDPDILIRTSKAERLSDFLLWQISSDCHVHFLEENWPELSYWNLFKVIFQFQRSQRSQRKSSIPTKERLVKFVEEVNRKRMNTLRDFLD